MYDLIHQKEKQGRHSNGAVRRGVTACLLLFVVGLATMHDADGQPQENLIVSHVNQASVEAPIKIKDRRLELSGCAVVEGGVLVVEDELIGAVLFLSDASGGFTRTEMAKLERKKKASAPFTDLSRLFPVQDFEDIASDGHSMVFVIGSHQGKEGLRRPDREFLVQAEWSARDCELKVVREQYDLLAWMAPALEKIGCSINLTDEGVSDRLNVEGLALHNGTLYVGLRSPRSVAGNALVLYGPAEDWLRASGSPAVLELDLEGAGIRALDWDTKYDTLLVLSGSAEDDAKDVQAALWSINPDAGSPTRVLQFDDSVSRRHPEGVCRLAAADGGNLLVVLDGEGAEEGGSLLHVEW